MYTFPSHWHSEIEIIHCVKGSFSAIVSGRNYSVSAGETVFVASAEPHEYPGVEAGTKCLLVEIGAGFLKQNFDELAKYVFDKTVMEIIPGNIRNLFDKIIPELQNPCRKSGEWIVSGCLFELSAYLLRDLPGKVDISSQRYEKIRAMQRVSKSIEYIGKNYHKKITINDAASEVALEKSNFCRQFKKATQMTFHSYLNMFRVSKACIHLKETNDTVSAVAEKTGFPETKTFCRVFRELMNQTPGEYRKR